MDITLVYFDECPNWQVADQRLAAIATVLTDVTVTRQRVETLEEAERLRRTDRALEENFKGWTE